MHLALHHHPPYAYTQEKPTKSARIIHHRPPLPLIARSHHKRKTIPTATYLGDICVSMQVSQSPNPNPNPNPNPTAKQFCVLKDMSSGLGGVVLGVIPALHGI